MTSPTRAHNLIIQQIKAAGADIKNQLRPAPSTASSLSSDSPRSPLPPPPSSAGPSSSPADPSFLQHQQQHEQLQHEQQQQHVDEERRKQAIQRLRQLKPFSGEDCKPVRVLDGLFIGAIGAAKSLEALAALGITHIVNASPIVPCYHKDTLRYQLVGVYDAADAPIDAFFEPCNAFIDEGRAQGGVLVHCYAGVSRSATLILAYLVGREGMAPKQALQRLREARPAAQPNAGFLRQLEAYAQSLGGLGGGLAADGRMERSCTAEEESAVRQGVLEQILAVHSDGEEEAPEGGAPVPAAAPPPPFHDGAPPGL